MSARNSRLQASKSPSRTRTSRSASPSYLPGGAESLLLQDGLVGEQATEFIQEFAHTREFGDETEIEVDHDPVVEDSDDESILEHQRVQRQKLPWWKQPSPWWFIVTIPFSTIATTACLAPRIEIFTNIICDAYKAHRGHLPPDWDTERLGTTPPETIQDGIVLTAYASSDIPVAYGPWMSQAIQGFGGGDEIPLYFPNTSYVAVDESFKCSSDPGVQKGVATLVTGMATVMGVLSCLTTGAWTALSDRYGRTRLMGIAVVGLLVTDVTFIVVTNFPRHVPGGHWAYFFGAVIEGCLGGMTTSIAVIHAYLADCTTPASRSRVFSRYLGLLFTGVALGPTLGSILIRETKSLMSVFYVSIVAHVILASCIWFVIPESLLPMQMAVSRRRYAEEIANRRRSRGIISSMKGLVQFLSPLSVLSPIPNEEAASPHKQMKLDWNLLCVAVAYGCTTMLMGATQYIFQYTSAVYGWSSEIVGYWLSTVGAARAAFLTLMLPLVIQFFKPKPPAVHLPTTPSEPLDARSRSPDATAASPQPPTEHHTPSFDLALARISVFIEIIAHTAMLLAPTGLAFVGATALNAFGAGFSPTVQSLALELYKRRGGVETGKLFGALSVMQALGSQILGPFVFGVVYINTVGTLPQAIFFVLIGLVLISLIMLMCVRLPPELPPAVPDLEGEPSVGGTAAQQDGENTPLILVEGAPEDEQGRGSRLK